MHVGQYMMHERWGLTNKEWDQMSEEESISHGPQRQVCKKDHQQEPNAKDQVKTPNPEHQRKNPRKPYQEQNPNQTPQKAKPA